MAEAALQTQGLSRFFGGFAAVRDVSLTVAEGSVHALIGPNGAGKTTCFHLLSRFLDPSCGTIRYFGRDITRMRPHALARAGLVRSFQISAVFGAMTALENVRLAVALAAGEAASFLRHERRLARYEGAARALLAEVGLAGREGETAAALSYGGKRALEIATTLAAAPRLMLLDEPTAGLAHEDVPRIAALIRRAAQGRTVLMVEHNLGVVRGLCDRITVLARGCVLAEGDYATIAADERVRAAYLGGVAGDGHG